MPKHDVHFGVPERPLGRADVVFKVYRDGGMWGTLEISKGSVVWFRANRQYGHKMGWKRFADMMEEHATRFEKRKR
jgi:hypothetical protein